MEIFSLDLMFISLPALRRVFFRKMSLLESRLRLLPALRRANLVNAELDFMSPCMVERVKSLSALIMPSFIRSLVTWMEISLVASIEPLLLSSSAWMAMLLAAMMAPVRLVLWFEVSLFLSSSPR